MSRRYFLLIKHNEVFAGKDILMVSFVNRKNGNGVIFFKDGRREPTKSNYSLFIPAIERYYEEISIEEAALII